MFLSEILMVLLTRLPLNSIVQRLYNPPNNNIKCTFFLSTSTKYASLIEYIENDHKIVLTKQLDLMDFVHIHENPTQDLSIVASCDEVVLGRVIHNHGDYISESLRLISLFTGTYLILGPDQLLQQQKGLSIRYDLGYSPCSRRYKVLRSEIDMVTRRVLTVKILTINSGTNDDTWRLIYSHKSDVYNNEILEQIMYLSDPVVLNNAIHWMVSRSNKIVRFDLDKEEFESVPMPYDKDLSIGQLGVVCGCLCMLASHEVRGSSDRVEIWVMNKYGVQDSWTQLAVVKDFNIDVPLKLICVLDNGKFLFQSNSRLSLYDPAQEKWDDKVIRVAMNNPVITTVSIST